MVIVGMLNGTVFIAQPRTPGKQQFHRVLVETGTNVQDWLAEDTLINCTHLATVTRTSGATIQQSASRQNPSFGSLERALYGCPVYTRPFQHSRANVDIRVSRLPHNQANTCLALIVRVTFNHDVSEVRVK